MRLLLKKIVCSYYPKNDNSHWSSLVSNIVLLTKRNNIVIFLTKRNIHTTQLSIKKIDIHLKQLAFKCTCQIYRITNEETIQNAASGNFIGR